MSDTAGKDPSAIIRAIESLPAPPPVAAKILALAASEEADLGELADLIQTDASLTLKLLRLANAAGNRRLDAVETVSQAVMVLGLAKVRSIALCVAAREAMCFAPAKGDPLVGAVWKHSLACAVGAKLLSEAAAPELAERAFACALAHDCGKLVLILADADAYARLAAKAEDDGADRRALEEQHFGMDHCAAGKRLLETWGLPEIFVEAAWLHHLPGVALASPGAAAKTTQLVALADILAHEVMCDRPGTACSLDRGALDKALGLGGDARLDEVKARIGHEYAEQAMAFDLDADAAGFYFQALGRANARLGKLELASSGLAEAASRAGVWHGAVSSALAGMSRAADAGELCRALAEALAGFRGEAQALAYLMADPEPAGDDGPAVPAKSGRLAGYALAGGTGVALTGRLEPGPAGSTPVFDQSARLSEPMLAALATAAARAGLSSASGQAPVLMQHGCLIVPIYPAGGGFGQSAGEMILYTPALAPGDTERDRALALLSDLAGQAAARLRLLESCRDRAERLAQALRLMQAVNLKLLQAERLAAVGQLAAGAAHEINNPLAIVYARTQLLEIKETDPAKKKVFRQMLEQIERITHILANLMDFARPASLRVEDVNPEKVLEKTLALVRSGLDKLGIEVELDIEANLPAIKADSRQLEQVFLNLLINAEHAMEATGGVLRLSAAFDPGGRTVSIAVADTGVGIAPENLDKIFDPFFTTKEEGKGTGLGLSTAYGIVTKHMGEIKAESAPGKGTNITVILPLDPAKAAGAPEQAGESPQDKVPGGPSVLVVDDELNIRDILRESLENVGYTVITAKNGDEGLSLLSRRRFSLLILDVRMPGLGGLDLLREAKNIAGFATPVLVLTGLASPEELDQAMALGAAACIRKPFQIEALIAEAAKLAPVGERT